MTPHLYTYHNPTSPHNCIESACAGNVGALAAHTPVSPSAIHPSSIRAYLLRLCKIRYKPASSLRVSRTSNVRLRQQAARASTYSDPGQRAASRIQEGLPIVWAAVRRASARGATEDAASRPHVRARLSVLPTSRPTTPTLLKTIVARPRVGQQYAELRVAHWR